MGHDYTYCVDYKEGECPNCCWRIPMPDKAAAFAHLDGTEYCPKGADK